MTESEITAMGYLPERIALAVSAKSKEIRSTISEVRLRSGGELSITSNGKNYPCGVVCTKDELDFTVGKLTKNSLYSHAQSIAEGVITTEHGIRAGVCGRAVVSDGRISCVRDISSASIRIPHRVCGAAEPIRGPLESRRSVLIYSPPGVGKTTVLREVVPIIAGDLNMRCALIDTRYELSVLGVAAGLCDVFLGYPRYEGIMSAVRTMSPEYVICDEISDERDALALRYAHSSGVAVCASAHATVYEDLMKSEVLSSIIKNGVFDFICGIEMYGEERRLVLEAVND